MGLLLYPLCAVFGYKKTAEICVYQRVITMDSTSTVQNILRKDLSNAMLKLTLSFYNIPHISRKSVGLVINIFSEFFSVQFIPFVKNEIENLVKPISNETAYLKTQFVRQESTYITDEEKRVSFQMKPVYGTYVSLKDTVQETLSIPGVLESIFNYMSDWKKENKYLSNLIQADLWTTKYKHLGDNVLPLYLYYDEFETRNPLGSHAGKEKLGVYTFH